MVSKESRELRKQFVNDIVNLMFPLIFSVKNGRIPASKSQ